MTLFGYFMALLNVIAAGAFLYLALMDYGVRQAWSYAVYRYDFALNGIPVDMTEPDEKGEPRYLNMDDALPTEDEKKQRIEDAKKQPKERADPTADPNYQKMLGVLGTRAVAAALDEQAHALLDMATNVKVARDEARRRFADTHDGM